MPADDLVTMLQKWIEVSRHQSMHDFIRYAREQGLGMSHLGALKHIYYSGPCTVTALADHLGISGAAGSQMLERFVQQGLALRSVDPDDRRVKIIELTEEGRRVMAESVCARRGWLEDLAESFSDDEQALVFEALQIMVDKTVKLGALSKYQGCHHPGCEHPKE